MTLFSRVTEICRERLPSIRVARITIDSIYDLDKMLQPGIRFGVTVRNTSELIGTPIAQIEFFYFSVDVMDGDERMIIQRMETWRNGTYKAFYRIFYDEVCQTRLDGLDGVELGWRDAYDVFQLNSQIKSELAKKAGVYNLSVNVPAVEGYYTMDKDDLETPYAPDYVPVANRKVGLLITFMSYTGWQTWQYRGIEAIIGEVLEDDWLNPFYWKQKDAESVLTKAAIEEKLTGDIETHTHEHLNQLCELVAVRTAHPDITIEVYEQGAKYYNSLTNLIHTLDYSDEVNPWYYAEQPKVGVLYYSLSDESSSYAKLWRYTGIEMLEIPVHPSLALGEELGTAYEGSKGKANADAIASIASKLEGIQDNAEVNQNAFSSIIVGSSTIASNDKTDTFELVEGSNITLSSSGKKITISSSYVDAGYAALAGSTSQDFSTKNLNVAGYIQVGSARIVYVPEDPDTGTPGYIKIQHADGSTAMHLVTTGGQTLYSTGVPAAIEELLTEVMVTYNTSEEKADIIVADRTKSRFMVIVPSTTSGIIAINTIFNNIVPFGFLAEYEIYVYIESNDVTATTLATSCSGISGYTSGLMVGTLQASDISGKGLHKLTYIRDRATADTHMSLYVKHEYFEKL